MTRKLKTMDGNTAAAHVSYAFTEVAGIYPITPSSPMADCIDQWSAAGEKNIFGNPVKVVELQSEGGAAGTVHGSLAAGALTTTYTASQGLLLMIPNMYKMAGELLPCVFHVSARTVSSHALNIFGDHSDVYACRQTGFAMLCETNPQEVMDLSPVAHMAAIKGRIPFLNFFDGFRTSHEIQKIAVWNYEDLKELCDMNAVEEFRRHCLNPERPYMRGSHENGDTFFQHREACNQYYDKLPDIVEECMEKINAKIGTDYKLFNYYGAEDAESIIIAMGSVCDLVEEAVDYLNAKGEKTGVVKVRLYRPFSAEKLVAAIPQSVKRIAVLDRTKEPGSIGEPLYMDVVTALANEGRNIEVIGGRYGLGSKNTPPKSVFAVFEELKREQPKQRFTIGINDDVTHLSLPEHPVEDISAPGTIKCKFWGLGGDGTVGANKNSIKIIGDHTDKYVQAYFQYDSKKTGGVTVSHLRFGDTPIKSPYYIKKAHFVACHNPSYLDKDFPIIQDLKPNGTFLINCQWDFAELEQHLKPETKRYIAEKNIKVYTINAIDIAAEIGMDKRTNTILQAAFFKLANIIPEEEAVRYMKEAATRSYLKKGQDIVDMNHKAIDLGMSALKEIEVPEYWKTVEDIPRSYNLPGKPELVDMVNSILRPIVNMRGDDIPVSAFLPHADGQFELGASAYEKRNIAVKVPVWNSDKCVQCNKCAFVCPHAAIRPFVFDDEEAAKAPEFIEYAPIKAGAGKGKYQYMMAVSPMDCMGCGVCISECPTGAIEMKPNNHRPDQQKAFQYAVYNTTEKADMFGFTVKGSQFRPPMLEFSGSCAGCAETSYARLVAQLFGDRMYIANATGCSSIWGNPVAAAPYCTNQEGHGPAWSNSLFEDNAEHGYGLHIAQKIIRDSLIEKVEDVMHKTTSLTRKALCKEYLDTVNDGEANRMPTKALIANLEANVCCDTVKEILAQKEYLSKKSIWIFGGDGWAYDIGFGGLDHVLATGEDVNVFVFDTEVYSNTGGQASKASNIGQVAQFAANGKPTKKKSLSEIAMSYGYVYVAQVAMGADPAQTMKAIREAEAYNGPSLIIGYSPCEMHSIKGGMINCQKEMKKAVDCGYWNLFRFNPNSETKFILDSAKPEEGYREFLMNEARYSRLTREFPERADSLFELNEAAAKERYEHLEKLVEMYK